MSIFILCTQKIARDVWIVFELCRIRNCLISTLLQTRVNSTPLTAEKSQYTTTTPNRTDVIFPKPFLLILYILRRF